ncbi:MAG: hypothetical protein WC390_06475 [Sulfurimonas sp.]|jgi:hypothetical protein
MKTIIKPATREHSVIHCDFTGEKLDMGPPLTLTLDFAYGSDFDGSCLEMHLSESGEKELLAFIKEKLTKQTKETFAAEIDSLKQDFTDNIDIRDLASIDFLDKNISLHKYLSN